jgi:hypothetical protein
VRRCKLRFLVGTLVLTLGLAVTGTALAAAPVLLSVGHVDRHPTATWSLPAGVQSRVIEVATSPATEGAGEFVAANVTTWDNLDDFQTSWTSSDQLEPGTYYVHVSGFHLSCGPCPLREYSNVLTLVIDGSGGGVQPPVQPPAGTLPAPTALALVQRTVGSITFSWQAPAGVAIDRYLVFRDGLQVAEVPGTALSYQDTGLAPATDYRYAVTGASGSELTAQSAELVAETVAPPLAQARLAGRFDVTLRVISTSGIGDLHKGARSTETWSFTPGASKTRLRGESPGGSWRMTLSRKGTSYSGRTTGSLWQCFFSDVRSTMTLTLRVKKGDGVDGKWRVTSFTGAFTASGPGKTTGLFKCPPGRYTASVSGTLER